MIGISWTYPEGEARAQQLAQHLQLPIVDSSHSHLLLITPQGLKLQTPQGCIQADFIKGKAGYLRQRAQHHPLAKALPKAPQNIIDATAGLGIDAFLMASLGHQVTLLERSPIIHALLQDGLERAQQDLQCAETLPRLTGPILCDAETYLQNLSPNQYPDIIYLDPMFPKTSKSALPKKEMQVLRHILPHDDADKLASIALQHTKKRLIIKRALHSPSLMTIPPNHQFSGKRNRYDVYIAQIKNI